MYFAFTFAGLTTTLSGSPAPAGAFGFEEKRGRLDSGPGLPGGESLADLLDEGVAVPCCLEADGKSGEAGIDGSALTFGPLDRLVAGDDPAVLLSPGGELSIITELDALGRSLAQVFLCWVGTRGRAGPDSSSSEDRTITG